MKQYGHYLTTALYVAIKFFACSKNLYWLEKAIFRLIPARQHAQGGDAEAPHKVHLPADQQLGALWLRRIIHVAHPGMFGQLDERGDAILVGLIFWIIRDYSFCIGHFSLQVDEVINLKSMIDCNHVIKFHF